MQDRAEGIGSQHRNLSDILAKIIFAFGALSTAYHLYVLMVQPIQPWILRSFHLTSSGILVFALIPWKADKKSEGPNLLDYSLAFLLVTTTIYLIVDFDSILYRVGVDPNGYDVLFATITFLIILEMGRRLQGYVLPILALVCLAYALWGDYLPGLWGHRGYSFQRVVTYLYSLEGIFGPPLAASSTFIILFILFGAALQSSGAGRLFIDTSLAIAGGARGGPAKVAVFASSLFGTMSAQFGDERGDDRHLHHPPDEEHRLSTRLCRSRRNRRFHRRAAHASRYGGDGVRDGRGDRYSLSQNRRGRPHTGHSLLRGGLFHDRRRGQKLRTERTTQE